MERDGHNQGQQTATVTDLERARQREEAQAEALEERRKQEEAQAQEIADRQQQAEERAKAIAQAQREVQQVDRGGDGGGWKKWAILGGVGTLVLLLLIGWGLYVLGGDLQSPLERLRDIAIIFIVLLFFLVVVILAGIAAALGFLVLQIKDRVIPLLEELTGTVRRVRGTTQFVTEEAVKPILSVASAYAKMRAMTKTVTGQDRKKRRR